MSTIDIRSVDDFRGEWVWTAQEHQVAGKTITVKGI